MLTPVGSSGGDRYYVQAHWDPKNRRVTGLFHRELASTLPLQDEQKLMADRSERLVFWYTKEWALSIAGEIDACGGKASFPNQAAKKQLLQTAPSLLRARLARRRHDAFDAQVGDEVAVVFHTVYVVDGQHA